jgi:hypothetical protein
MNPNALVLWAFLFLVGFLVGGVTTGLVFLAGGLLISILAALLDSV